MRSRAISRRSRSAFALSKVDEGIAGGIVRPSVDLEKTAGLEVRAGRSDRVHPSSN